jgi:WD40 repeat protein/serine/threonine protein kinase
MSSGERCRECDTAIPADSPGGYCGQCLLGLGLQRAKAPEPGRQGSETQATRVATEKSGDQIGRYRLLEEIGHGGCGVVYMAEQEEPVRRKVALKVIKLGMDTRQVVARFEVERQALALMDHPNIAKVLDAGTTDTGRPYFVMELVGGIKITDYCDQHGVSMRQRLDLFIQVCRAIQHAHQKGIIHRDIKPSNVLVATQDGEPMPKVIDFGIAKATQGRLTDQTLFTAFEQFIGTPAYMSPEQTQLGALDVDTRSDIYSLGVLLYELLTGKTPFETKELVSAGLDEIRRTIREKEPLKPSTRLTQELVAAVVRRRNRKSQSEEPASLPQRLSTKELIHSLRGDLDWIAMKCLEKDRTRRYETANSLARDIERHLNNEPVVARPPSKLYEFQKTVRRHKFGFAAATALIAVLVMGSGGILWQWRRATRHAELETSERQRAEQATQRALATLAQMEAIEVRRAEEYYQAGDRRGMLPYLALVLRQNPTNRIAAERLMSTLSHRNWARLACPPMEHSNRLTCAIFSADGKRVVTSAADHTACVWDAATGRRIAGPFTHSAEINTAVFSLDRRLVVTASKDKTARIWDAVTGVPVGGPLPHQADVVTAQFSPDGKLVLTTSGNLGQLWNVSTGQRTGAAFEGTELVLDARFSPDGSRVALACAGGQAQVWEIGSSTCLHRLQHSGNVWWLGFSPDGKRLVTASGDKTARVWDMATGRPITEPLQHQERVWGAEFSPDGQRVVTASEDRTAQIWDASNGQKVGPPLKHDGAVRIAMFSPEGLRVVTGSWDKTVRVWNALTGEPLTEPMAHDSRVFGAQFSPDGERVLTACNGKAALIWQVIGTTALTFQVGAGAAGLDFSPDGRQIVVASDGAHTRVWDVLNGRPATPPLSHPPGTRINQAVFSPDGKLVATACDDGNVRIWGAADGRLMAGPFSDDTKIQWIDFSPDGARLLTTRDAVTAVWDVRTGKRLCSIPHAAKLSLGARFSPDGTHILTATETGIGRVWEAHSGAPVTPPLAHAARITSAQFSVDGRYVLTAAGDSSFFIWETSSGRRLEKRWEHRGPVTSARFSRDGRRVLTLTLEYGAQIWALDTDISLIGEFGARFHARDAVFSPDQSKVLIGYYDNTCEVWDSSSGQRLSEPLPQGDSGLWFRQCSLDGRYFAVALSEGKVRIWETPKFPLPVPDWLPNLADALAGQRFDQHGSLVSLPSAELWGLEEKLRALGGGPGSEALSNHTGNSPSEPGNGHNRPAPNPSLGSASGDDMNSYDRWARWFVAQPSQRTVLPSSPLTIAEYAQSSAQKGGSLTAMRDALLLQPANAIAMAAFALVNTNALQADWLSRRAMEQSPVWPGTLWAREKILRESERYDEALALLEGHRSLWADNPWIWANKGGMLEKLGRLEEALADYTRAISLSRPDDPTWPAYDRELRRTHLHNVLLLRWRLLKRMNRPAEAQADFLEARHIPARTPRVEQSP